MERRPTKELAPVITNWPPGKDLRNRLFPASRERGAATSSRSVGVASISGSMRTVVFRRTMSSEGITSIAMPGAFWMM